MDPDQVLENIVVRRLHNTEDLLGALKQARPLLASGSPYGLIVLDSPMRLYRSEYTGLPELPVRQQHLGRVINLLRQLADEFDLAGQVVDRV